MPNPSAIPIIDLAGLGGASGARPAVGEQLVAACRNPGSFYITNHGIPAEVIARAFEVTKIFFSRPEAEKDAIHSRLSPPYRGYVRVQERKRGSAALLDQRGAAGDLKENLDLGPALPQDDPDVRPGNPFYGPNVWPPQPPGFRTAIERYDAELKMLAVRLVRVIALGLGINGQAFAANFDRPLTRMKLIHYPPPAPEAVEVPEGVGAHSDYSCFTILAQDDVGGLEIFDKSGRGVIPAPPVAGALFINVGDQLARWTNDEFWPTVHRVFNAARRDRFSIAFFVHPNFTATISCLAPCAGPGRPPKYPPVRAGDDLLERLRGSYERQ